LYATGAPAWVTPRWFSLTVDEVYPAALTEAGLNNLEVMLYFFDPYGSGGPGNIIDALRLKVYTGISATIDFAPTMIIDNAPGPQYLKCKITLPAGFSAIEIDQSSISLDCVIAPSVFGTPNGPTLKVKFNMAAVKTHIKVDILQGAPVPLGGVDVTLNVTFSLTLAAGGTPFKGSDIVKYIVP